MSFRTLSFSFDFINLIFCYILIVLLFSFGRISFLLFFTFVHSFPSCFQAKQKNTSLSIFLIQSIFFNPSMLVFDFRVFRIFILFSILIFPLMAAHTIIHKGGATWFNKAIIM